MARTACAPWLTALRISGWPPTSPATYSPGTLRDSRASVTAIAGASGSSANVIASEPLGHCCAHRRSPQQSAGLATTAV